MDANRTYGVGLGTGGAALHEGGTGQLGVLAVAFALFAFAAFSFGAGAWRYVHMGRSLAEAEISQIKAWLVVAATLLLLACSLVAAGSALLIR